MIITKIGNSFSFFIAYIILKIKKKNYHVKNDNNYLYLH